MPKLAYVPKRFNASHREVIDWSNSIIRTYRAAGFSLTVRQLYYQFVQKNLIKNTMREYKRLGSIINDARLAGLIDWDAIEDRTRNLDGNTFWNSPRRFTEACADTYRVDMWLGQPARLEVWIEKQALVNVIEGVCYEHYVPWIACRGYMSQSEMWEAAQRVIRTRADHPEVERYIIVHLGDHDPSGIDMTRDIEDRLCLFCDGHGCERPEVHRIALTREQIDEYGPPPNPAKLTDSRCHSYIREHGDESWELDALTPDVMVELIRNKIELYKTDDIAWAKRLAVQDADRAKIKRAAKTIKDGGGAA